MPAYLVHGFRWPRQLIRIHIILHHLDDATANWLVSPITMRVMLEDFIESFPNQMQHLQNLRFVEQYDPTDYTNKSEEFAFVADIAHEVKLSVDVQEFIRQNEPSEKEQLAMVELKSSLQVPPEVGLGWYMVVCDDLVREAPIPKPGANGSNQAFLDSEYTARTPSRRKLTLTKKSRDNDPEMRSSLSSRSNDTSTALGARRRKSDAADANDTFANRNQTSEPRERRPQTAINTKASQSDFNNASSPNVGRGAAGRASDDAVLSNGSLTPKEGRRLRNAFSRFFHSNGA